MITITQLATRVMLLAEEHPEATYRPREDWGPSFLHWGMAAGHPGCLLGQALRLEGVSLEAQCRLDAELTRWRYSTFGEVFSVLSWAGILAPPSSEESDFLDGLGLAHALEREGQPWRLATRGLRRPYVKAPLTSRG